MSTLREHQRAAVQATVSAYEAGQKSGLWHMADRTGVTAPQLELARCLGGRSLILVSRRADLDRLRSEALEHWRDEQIGVVEREYVDCTDRSITLGCVNAFRPGRLSRFEPSSFRLLVVSECHHTPSPSWRRVLDHFKPEFLLGTTGTPDRRDGRDLSPWFGPEPTFSYTIHDAIRDGILVPPRQGDILEDVGRARAGSTRGGNTRRRSPMRLAREERDQLALETYSRQAAGRKAIIFARDTNHVKSLVARFRAAGTSCAGLVTGMRRAERDRILEGFRGGQLRVLINCRICAQGHADPEVECVVMMSQTSSRALYQDFVSVGLEPCPGIGKRDCLVLDLANNSARHALTPLEGESHKHSPVTPAAKGGAMYQSAFRPGRIEEMYPAATQPSPVRPAELEASPPPDQFRPGFHAGVDQSWRQYPWTLKQQLLLQQLGVTILYALTRGEASDLIGQHLRRRRSR